MTDCKHKPARVYSTMADLTAPYPMAGDVQQAFPSCNAMIIWMDLKMCYSSTSRLLTMSFSLIE